MPEESNLSQAEVKMLLLVSKFDAMQKHCDDLTKKVEHHLVWKHDLDLIDKDIKALGHEIEGVTHLLEKDIASLTTSVESLDSKNTWLVRLLFGLMASSGAGLLVFLVQQIGK